MLIYISSSQDYLFFRKEHRKSLSISDFNFLRMKDVKKASWKLKKLDCSLISDILFPLYSIHGRPAVDPAILLRSFILMLSLDYTSLHKWCDALQSNRALQYLVGSFSPPGFGTHYDFISRLTGKFHHLNELYPKDYYTSSKQLTKKFGKPKKEEKLNNYSHSKTELLFHNYKDGADFDRNRTLYTLQLMFHKLAVIPSIDTGFIDTTNDFTLSGDGSALHIHASPFGHELKDLDDSVVNRVRYSAPDADIGWDSHEECFYLGFSMYNIAYHNKDRSIDLPVFLDLNIASQHDSITTITAAAQLFDLDSTIKPKYMCFDSASDSLAIFKYFHHLNITPIIDHNTRRTKSDKSSISDNGKPICDNGIEMIDCGYDLGRCRRKFRCPLALGKIDSCPHKDQCSKTDYGRTVYINDGDNLRLSGPIAYKSDKWKDIYNNRTSTERINNRILNDYNLQHMRIRNKAKNAFFMFIAGICIHLDAWIKEEWNSYIKENTPKRIFNSKK